MKILVPFFEFVNSITPLADLSLKANGIERHKIDMVPWPVYDYKPDASFAIAHGDNCILLKYYVSEKSVRAIYCKPNDPVYKDTCVEFFISFGNEKEYYNFEFNCIGTCLIGFGINRAERKLLPAAIIRKIESQSVFTSFDASVPGNISWELTLMIPIETFCYHSLVTLKNQDCKVNFYKCGDDLPEPHFLAWNDIKTINPDFHLSEYFGEMKFV